MKIRPCDKTNFTTDDKIQLDRLTVVLLDRANAALKWLRCKIQRKMQKMRCCALVFPFASQPGAARDKFQRRDCDAKISVEMGK